MCALLLHAGADIDAPNADGHTPLAAAASAGAAAAVGLLLDAGADAAARSSWERQTALQLAAIGGHADAVRALGGFSPPNVGVVGPYCAEGNTLILTHDFVHRTHLQIFAPHYYPPVFSDWWMDDWISKVRR